MLKLKWPWTKKNDEVAWKFAPVPKDFNKSQLDCVSSAKWHYQEMRLALNESKEFPSERVASCFWFIVFSHFEGFTDLQTGYTLNMTVPRIIERTRTAMIPVLLPKLEEIIRCEDQEQKALLTYQYVHILMAAVFDPSGTTIHYNVLREVLEVGLLDAVMRDFSQRNRGKFLEPLGFKPHHFKEDGEDYTTWYWPTQ